MNTNEHWRGRKAIGKCPERTVLRRSFKLTKVREAGISRQQSLSKEKGKNLIRLVVTSDRQYWYHLANYSFCKVASMETLMVRWSNLIHETCLLRSDFHPKRLPFEHVRLPCLMRYESTNGTALQLSLPDLPSIITC